MRFVFAAIAVAAAVCVPAASAQEPSAPAPPGKRRVSPPQPQQVQGADYLAGTWRVTWTGRESPVTTGPRSGTVTFARRNAGSVLDVRVEGTVESRRIVQGNRHRRMGRREEDPDARRTACDRRRAAIHRRLVVADRDSRRERARSRSAPRR